MLTREQERQLEVYALMAPFWCPTDFEEAAYQLRLQARAERRRQRLETKLLDVGRYRALAAEAVGRGRLYRVDHPGYCPNVSRRDAREARAMYQAGAPIALIAKALKTSGRNVSEILVGRTHNEAGGYVHPAVKRGRGERVRVVRGAAHPRASLTREIVDRILSMPGSNRVIARAIGNISHRTVGQVKNGRSWLQRAEAAE